MKILKRVMPPMVAFIVGVGVIMALVNNKKAPYASNTPDKTEKITVAVKAAQPEMAALSVTTQGTVEPKRRINLVSEVSGRVIHVASQFDDGGFVQQGELLVQLDDRDYRAQFLDAQARLASAEQLLAQEQGRSKQARQEWRDIGSQEANELFLRVPQLNAAKAEVASAQAALDTAQANLERTQLTAPFDGRIDRTFDTYCPRSTNVRN